MTSRGRFLVIGAGLWPWYEQACQQALVANGHEVERISYAEYFYKPYSGSNEISYRSFLARIQHRFLVGPLLWKINNEILLTVERFQPDVIWLFNCTHVFPRTLERIRRKYSSVKLVQYVNDNPFTYGHHVRPDYYRHFKRSIPLHHLHFVYRQSNVEDFKSLGIKDVYLLRSYFIPEEDYRVSLGRTDSAYQSDIVFVGHYEADGRLQALEALARQGFRLNLFGPEWHRGIKSLASDSPLRSLFPVRRVLGNDYRKAISGAKIALCFLSRINADTYTRRNFQIPAMETFMLSEYSDDLATLFAEGIEAEYFRTVDELVDKVRYYLKHEDLRSRIARKGYERVWKDGHDVRSRMKQFARQVLNRG
jgi:spore maturation protein CgeB